MQTVGSKTSAILNLKLPNTLEWPITFFGRLHHLIKFTPNLANLDVCSEYY